MAGTDLSDQHSRRHSGDVWWNFDDTIKLAVQVTVQLTQTAPFVIRVSAFRLFVAQPYSLAVIGDFNGTLSSPANPAFSGPAPSCSQPIVTISSSPPRYTQLRNATFRFATDAGENPARLEAESCKRFLW